MTFYTNWRAAPTTMRAVAALVAILVLAAACSGSKGSAGSAIDDAAPPELEQAVVAAPTGAANSANSANSAITLDVTAWKGNEAEPAGLAELFERYEAQHPDVSIELTYISRVDSDFALPKRLEDDDPPDVMMTDMPLVSYFAGEDQLVDLGTDREWYSRLPTELRTALTIDEHAYIMPFEVIGMGNFVNVDLLARVGIAEPPTTVAELKEACRRLADADIKPLVFTGAMSASLFLIANGLQGTDVSPAALGSGETKFADNAAFSQGIDQIHELIDARCFDPAEAAGLDPWSTALTSFKEGRVAMIPQGAWNIAAFDAVDNLDYVFTPIPASTPGGVAVDLFGVGWSIPVGAENAEAARAFVDWFALPEQVQVVLDAEGGYTPFDDGTTGIPILAARYNEARAAGMVINYPVALGEWPKELEAEIWASLTALLLNPSMSNDSVLSRWDRVVEEEGGQ